jgi:hypothetical protein
MESLSSRDQGEDEDEEGAEAGEEGVAEAEVGEKIHG